MVELLTGLLPFKSSFKKFLLKHKNYIAEHYFSECPHALFIENWEYSAFCDTLSHILGDQVKTSTHGNGLKVLFLVEEGGFNSLKPVREEELWYIPERVEKFNNEIVRVIPGKLEQKIIKLESPIVKQFLFMFRGKVFRSFDIGLVNTLDHYNSVKFKQEPIKIFGTFRTKIIQFYLSEQRVRGFRTKTITSTYLPK